MKVFQYVMRGVAPLIVVGLGWYGAQALIAMKPEVETRPPEETAPLVETFVVEPTSYRVRVESYGTVRPRTESWLVAEVSGRVTSVAPELENGRFFDAGEELLRIDPRDYELAVAEAELALARAGTRLLQEQADAEVARREWEEIGGGAEPTPLVLREPQVKEARAAVAAAQAALDRAERDLERTVVRAPYDGRVRETVVDVGQFVQRGASLAKVYAVDFAEVRLPLPDTDVAYLDLPFGFRENGSEPRPPVRLWADFAGMTFTWDGEIVRTEGEIDAQTSMVVAVCRVPDPYGRARGSPGTALDVPPTPENGRSERMAPLAAGLFVRGVIEGDELEGVFLLPRRALRDGDTAYVMDGEGRLRMRRVHVAWSERDHVLIDGGLEPGDLVVSTPLEIATEGMLLRRLDRAFVTELGD